MLIYQAHISLIIPIRHHISQIYVPDRTRSPGSAAWDPGRAHGRLAHGCMAHGRLSHGRLASARSPGPRSPRPAGSLRWRAPCPARAVHAREKPPSPWSGARTKARPPSLPPLCRGLGEGEDDRRAMTKDRATARRTRTTRTGSWRRWTRRRRT